MAVMLNLTDREARLIDHLIEMEIQHEGITDDDYTDELRRIRDKLDW